MSFVRVSEVLVPGTRCECPKTAGGFLAALGGGLPFEVGRVTEVPGTLETVLLARLPPRVGVKVR